MERETAEILEVVNFIKDRMVTKDDLAEMGVSLRTEMRTGFADIQAELRDIRSRLDALESAVENMSGYAKEIDHIIERVSAIEKHLGLRPGIAA